MRTPPTVTNSHNTQTHSPIHIRHKALSMLQTVYIHHPLHHAHTPRIHNPSLPPFPLLTHPCHNLLQSTLRLIAHHIPPNTTKPLPIPNCTLTPPFFAETLRHTFLRILIHNPPLIPLLPRQNTKHPIRLHLPQIRPDIPHLTLSAPLPSPEPTHPHLRPPSPRPNTWPLENPPITGQDAQLRDFRTCRLGELVMGIVGAPALGEHIAS